MTKQAVIDYPDANGKISNKKKGRAQEIDKHIGEQLKKFRKMRHLTQEDLAAKLGISFQQIQKYENGKNRITFGRLYELSNFLDVSLESFVEGVEGAPISGMSDKEQDSISQKETNELLKVYYSLEDSKLRKNLLKLVKSMAENMKD